MLIKSLPSERMGFNVPVRSGKRKIRKTRPGKADDEAEGRGQNAERAAEPEATPSQRRCSERKEELLTTSVSSWNSSAQKLWLVSLQVWPTHHALGWCLLKCRLLGPVLVFPN